MELKSISSIQPFWLSNLKIIEPNIFIALLSNLSIHLKTKNSINLKEHWSVYRSHFSSYRTHAKNQNTHAKDQKISQNLTQNLQTTHITFLIHIFNKKNIFLPFSCSRNGLMKFRGCLGSFVTRKWQGKQKWAFVVVGVAVVGSAWSCSD